MSFIRPNTEERTGYQTGSMPVDSIDNACDFVMCYRFDGTEEKRINAFREKGYVVHFMTGISWGHYLDYLDGDFDGRSHWDEVQTDRFGNEILHSPKVPYMVPTVSFADYISEKLKKIVDLGVSAIYVEEPEFWDRAGYSEAFKREYLLYYRTPWEPPHLSTDAKYRCSKLKAYLYTRTIDRVSSAVKEYGAVKYGREIRFYVPTHSLINYTQWKIVSPEGKLADIPGVDGCIAQVWTGTSREKNRFNGIHKERTFETAFLEYGVMQELVKGTGKEMWFLHDPIEDTPSFDWDDYRKNYICTVSASLLHPGVDRFEICPWPNRVFEEKYPKNSPEAVSIPGDYATVLNNTFNTLGDMEKCPSSGLRTGVLTGDCQLYQREYPDCEFSSAAKEETGTVLKDSAELLKAIDEKLVNGSSEDRETLLKYSSSAAFPGFYSVTLPLLKYGVPVRPVLLDNVRRYPGYLDDYDVLVLSYEFMKPEFPDVNNALAQWVKAGGVLIYIGDGSDPFNKMNAWWTGGSGTPAQHLFDMLGIVPPPEKEIFNCGRGIAALWNISPCYFGYSEKNADKLRSFFTEAISAKGLSFEFSNSLVLNRGVYTVAAVMDESVSSEPLTLKGSFADMYSPAFDLIKEKTVFPGESTLLSDLDRLSDKKLCVIGTSVRVLSLESDPDTVTAVIRGAGGFSANIRLKVPFEIRAAYIDGAPCRFSFDAETSTVLCSFESVTGERKLILKK